MHLISHKGEFDVPMIPVAVGSYYESLPSRSGRLKGSYSDMVLTGGAREAIDRDGHVPDTAITDIL